MHFVNTAPKAFIDEVIAHLQAMIDVGGSDNAALRALIEALRAAEAA